MLKNVKIATKLPLLLAGLSALSIASVGIWAYVAMYRSVNNDALNRLKATQAMSAMHLNTEIKHIITDLSVIADTTTTAEAMQRLSSGFSILRREDIDPKQYLQKAYLKDNPNPANKRDRVFDAGDGSYYSKSHEKYHGWFKSLREQHKFYDIFLVNNTGDIIYTVVKESDYAANLSSPEWASSGLAAAVRGASVDKIGFADFAKYEASGEDTFAFFAQTVLDRNDKPIGKVAIQIPVTAFQHALHMQTDQSIDFDAYLVGADNKIRFSNDMRGTAAFTAYPNPNLVSKAIGQSGDAEQITARQDGAEIFVAYDAMEILGQKYALIWEAPYDQMMVQLNELRERLIIGALVTTLVVGLIGIWVARSITLPLLRLHRVLKKFVASGDCTLRIKNDRKDEIGESMEAMNEIMALAQASLISIRQSNDTATSVAEKMASSSQVLAKNAEVQSSSVEELSSSIEETESQVRSNADAAQEANRLSLGVANVVEDGKIKIMNMVGSMSKIKRSSEDIAKIIKVIDDIAFQTNLLALNAAVEAARAGHHGRGFAVVAQEVRDLAGRSAKAAKETSGLIEGSTNCVEEGVTVSQQAQEAFDVIAQDIEAVATIVDTISSATEEQARGMTYINRAIQEISDAAMVNAIRADELSVISGDLNASNLSVRWQIDQFQLGASQPKHGVPGALVTSNSAEHKTSDLGYPSKGTTKKGHSSPEEELGFVLDPSDDRPEFSSSQQEKTPTLKFRHNNAASSRGVAL